MAGIRLNVDDKQFREYLDKISNRIEKKDCKAILRKSSRPVVTQLKADTPRDSGALAQSVKSMTWSRTRDYFVSFANKPARYNRKKQIASDPFFAAFLNEGWVHHFIPNKGAVKADSEKEGTRAIKITQHKGFIQKATNKAGPAALKIIDTEVKKVLNNP